MSKKEDLYVTSLDLDHNFGKEIKAYISFNYKNYQISINNKIDVVEISISKGSQNIYINGTVEDAIQKVDELTSPDLKVCNDGCYFPEGIEGYWRKNIEQDSSGLLFPIVCENTENIYDKKAFLEALEEKESETRELITKGISMCRLTCEGRGNKEYITENWRWPEGYKEYIKLGVLPSFDFYCFIMNEENNKLPKLHGGK